MVLFNPWLGKDKGVHAFLKWTELNDLSLNLHTTMLEPWPLSLGVIAPKRVLSMDQIELFDI